MFVSSLKVIVIWKCVYAFVVMSTIHQRLYTMFLHACFDKTRMYSLSLHLCACLYGLQFSIPCHNIIWPLDHALSSTLHRLIAVGCHREHAWKVTSNVVTAYLNSDDELMQVSFTLLHHLIRRAKHSVWRQRRCCQRDNLEIRRPCHLNCQPERDVRCYIGGQITQSREVFRSKSTHQNLQSKNLMSSCLLHRELVHCEGFL